MDETTKAVVLAMVESIMQIDINPQYKITEADWLRVKFAKQKAMNLKAVLATETVIDDEAVPLLRGYRVRDINAAIAKYNASQSTYEVRAVKLGDEKILSSTAPKSWTTAGLEKLRTFGLRKPDDPDYAPVT